MVPFERYEKRDDLSFGFCFWGKERYEKRVFILFIVFFLKGKSHFALVYLKNIFSICG